MPQKQLKMQFLGLFYFYPFFRFALKYPRADSICASGSDARQPVGLDAFTKKYDPYWDIPLNENLPKPVIELPGVGLESANTAVGMVAEERGPFDLVMSNEAPVRRKRKK